MHTTLTKQKIITFAIVFLLVALCATGYLWHRGGFDRMRDIMQMTEGSIRVANSSAKYMKVGQNAKLLMQFAQRMDKKSVMAHFSAPANLTGSLAWQDDNLVFEATEPLVMGAEYTLTVGPEAKREDGMPLMKEIVFTYQVAGPPTIISRIPKPESEEVKMKTPITIAFDRPMVPLTAVHEQEKQFENWSVTIEPEVEGRWRWIGTQTVQFTPTKEFLPSTTYRVNVPPTLTAVSGESLIENFSFSFTTTRFALSHTSPLNGSKSSGPDTKITIRFNQEVNSMVLEKYIAFSMRSESYPNFESTIRNSTIRNNVTSDLTDLDTFTPLLFDITQATKKDENDVTIPDPYAIVITPKEKLTFKNVYGMHIKKEAHGTKGTLGLKDDYILRFATAGDMVVTSTKYEYGSVNISFSNRLNGKSLKGNILFDPPLEDWNPEDEWYERRDGTRSISLRPSFKPSTGYSVTVKKDGVQDTYEQPLLADALLSFTTPPVPQKVFIHEKKEFGIFERAKPPVFYINSVNVNALSLQMAKIPFDSFLDIQSKKIAHPNLAEYEQFQRWNYYTKRVQDIWEVYPLDVEERLGTVLQPGVYAIQIRSSEYTDRNGVPYVQQQYFTLTNLAVTLKHSGQHALVWVVNTQTGAPVENATIELIPTHKKTARLTGTTDAEGFFEVDLTEDFFNSSKYYRNRFYATATYNGDAAFVGSDWDTGIEPYNFSYSDAFWSLTGNDYQAESILYTDRPLYRVGDTAHFKGIVRLLNREGVYELPNREKRSASVRIEDARGNEIYKETLPLTALGSFTGTLAIDKKAPLGVYRIRASLVPETDISGNYFYGSFNVLAYRKPEYRVEVNFEEEDYFDNSTVKATIKGSYYFGAKMENANVLWSARSTDYFFNRYTDEWYRFSLYDSWCFYNCNREMKTVSSGEGQLDSKGQLHIDIPMELDDDALSQILTIEANITDANNQMVSTSASVPVHKANVYVGIKTDQYSVQPGDPVTARVIAVNPQGSPLKNQNITLKLYSRTWKTTKKKDVDGKYYYENDHKDTFISQVNVRTDAQGKAKKDIVIPRGGSFRIIAEAQDENDLIHQSEAGVYAWSSTYFNWPRSNSDRIDIVPDKPEYDVGDTATILIKSPYQGKNVSALVTIEREHVIQKKIIPIESNAQAIQIPITETMIPNVYVSVMVIKPRTGETFNDNGLDTGAPAFKMGLTQLKVRTERKYMDIAIETNKKKYLPKEEVTVKLKTTDWEGNPVSGEVSLAVVDMSLLDLMGYELPDLVRNFYSERGLGVRTAQMLLRLMERFKPGSKGGGGGDAMAKRGTFKDTAYWNPVIQTDENGEATLTFSLPDNLTTWKLTAIAQSADHTFGSKAEEIIETKQVILRPVRPRFAIHNDEMVLSAIVYNYMDEKASFTVSLSASGVKLTGKDKYKVRIKPGEQAKVSFPVRVERTDTIKLTFSAITKNARDIIEETIPAYPFLTPQTVATSGVTSTATQEGLYVPSKLFTENLSVQAILSPTIATYLPEGLEYVSEFPYQCAEQTMSRIFPNIALKELTDFEAFSFMKSEDLEEETTLVLSRLYTYQRGDGGFGYWENSRYSYPYLTAYIVHGLHTAREAGFTVDDASIDRAQSFLRSALSRSEHEYPFYWWMSDTTRAYILYVLAETGSVDSSRLSALYEKRASLPLFARAHLAMGLALEEGSSGIKKARTILEEIDQFAAISPRGVHFEEDKARGYRMYMNTNIRTTALVLQAMARIDQNNPYIPRIVRYLLSVREDGHWDTTQSTVQSVFAFIDILRQTGELDGDFDAIVSLNGTKGGEQHFDTENILSRAIMTFGNEYLKEGELNKIDIAKEGEGRLYYDLIMSYDWTDPFVPPAEEGIGILKTVEPIDKEKGMTLGSTHKVTLTMTVPDERYFVAVESPLPAGWEAVDFRFKTSQQGLNETINTDRPWESGLYYFNHREIRDDRIFLFADRLPAGIYTYEYIVRATTPGKFLVRPSRIWEMYFPEVFGQTEGGIITIEE